MLRAMMRKFDFALKGLRGPGTGAGKSHVMASTDVHFHEKNPTGLAASAAAHRPAESASWCQGRGTGCGGFGLRLSCSRGTNVFVQSMHREKGYAESAVGGPGDAGEGGRWGWGRVSWRILGLLAPVQLSPTQGLMPELDGSQDGGAGATGLFLACRAWWLADRRLPRGWARWTTGCSILVAQEQRVEIWARGGRQVSAQRLMGQTEKRKRRGNAGQDASGLGRDRRLDNAANRRFPRTLALSIPPTRSTLTQRSTRLLPCAAHFHPAPRRHISPWIAASRASSLLASQRARVHLTGGIQLAPIIVPSNGHWLN